MGLTDKRSILGLLLILICGAIDRIQHISAKPLNESSNEFGCSQVKQQCHCVWIYNEFEVSCPVPNPKIIVKVSPKTHLHVECTSANQSVYAQLPEIEIGVIDEVLFRRCPLPIGSSFARVMNHLGVRSVRVLRFTTTGADLPGSLVRQHFTGFNELERLVLTGSGLSVLPEDVFDDLVNLSWLDLRYNKIELPSNIFKNLPKLEFLELGYNNLETLDAGIFRNQNKLRQLILWGNNLQKLTKDSFIGATSVTELDLSANNIEKLPADVFEHLTELSVLNLNANNFTSLPAKLFSKNKNLSRLRLMDNRINLETLPDGFLANLTLLEEVIIRCNLRTVPENLFAGSKNMKNITMEQNALITLPADLFADQAVLWDLDLSSNQLSELHDGLFRNTGELRVLRLSHNRLEKISERIFRGLRNLKELYLDNNRLNWIHRYSFGGIMNVEIIDMHNNYLSFVELDQAYEEMGRGSPFQQVNELKELNLRNNSIVSILSDWTNLGLKLEKLDLSYNNITHLMFSDLHFLADGIKVNLTHNAIAEVYFDDFDMILLKNETVSEIKRDIILSDNPIRCDCISYNFIRVLRDESNWKRMKFTADNWQCAAPEGLAGRVVNEVPLKELVCPLDSPSTESPRCTRNCLCLVRPYDKALIFNCSNLGLTHVPSFPVLTNTNIRSIELYIENNNISNLPPMSLENVSEIHAKNNLITAIVPENLPRVLRSLDISHNRLNFINTTVLGRFNDTKSLMNISLGHNPWTCDCTAQDFLVFVKSHFTKISDLSAIKCSSGALLAKMNNLCPDHQAIYIVVSILIAVLGLFLGTVAALYYKYQQEIKIWLFAHNLCLWFVTEEELDKDKKYDAFISFSHKDEDFVTEQLVPELENGPHPFKICLHFRDWVVGEFIPNQISQSVEDSRRTIVVLSPNFLESIWGRMEFRAAHKNAITEGRARVIIIIKDDIGDIENLDAELKAYLNMNTYVKWGDPWFFRKLRYAMPHPDGYKSKNKLIKSTIKSSVDDKLELIKPQPVTPPLTTPPCEQAGQNPLIGKLNGENGKIISNGQLNGGLNGHVNGAFIINTNAKQSDV